MKLKFIIRKIALKLGFINDDFELDDYLDDTDSITKILEDGSNVLAKSGQDFRKFEPWFIEVKKEYDRQRAYKIRFEFIPPRQAFKNVRSYLQYTYGGFNEWKLIRDYCELKAGSKCVICHQTNFDFNSKDKTYTTATECHEHWHYNELTGIQKLVKLSSVCVQCHNIIHINMFSKNDEPTRKKFKILIDRYCFINDISLDQALLDFEFSIKERKRRFNQEYKLDLSLLNKFEVFEHEIKEHFNPHFNSFNSFIENKFKGEKDTDD